MPATAGGPVYIPKIYNGKDRTFFFFSYEGVGIFKPNLKEVKEGLNMLPETINLHVLQDMHLQLQEKLRHTISLITLSEKGVFYQKDNAGIFSPNYV